MVYHSWGSRRGIWLVTDASMRLAILSEPKPDCQQQGASPSPSLQVLRSLSQRAPLVTLCTGASEPLCPSGLPLPDPSMPSSRACLLILKYAHLQGPTLDPLLFSFFPWCLDVLICYHCSNFIGWNVECGNKALRFTLKLASYGTWVKFCFVLLSIFSIQVHIYTVRINSL